MRQITRRSLWLTAILALSGADCIRGSSAAGGDVWLSVLLATAVYAGLAALLFALDRRHPGKDLFAMLREARSPFTAKALTALWVLLGLGLAARTVRSWGEFVQSCVLPETPSFVVAAALIGTAMIFAVTGPHALTRWSGMVFPGAAALWLILMGLSVPHWDLSRLTLMADPGAVAAGTMALAAFPGGELILLTSLTAALTPAEQGSGRTLAAIALGVGALQLVSRTANVLVLSPEVAESLPYAGYFMTSVIGVGDFFRHVEVLTTFLAQFAVLAGLGLQLTFLSQGLSALAGIRTPGAFAFPAALLTYGLASCVTFAAAEALREAVGACRLLPTAAMVLTAAVILCPSRKIRRSAG